MKDQGNSSPTKARIYIAFMGMLAAGASAFGQNAVDPVRNNPYVPSPAGKTRVGIPSQKEANYQVAFVMQSQTRGKRDEKLNATNLDRTVTATEVKRPAATAPTDLYKVGVNDVLYIKLQNAAAGSHYYTVRPDGSIDFPLAGDNVKVAGLTLSEIDASLKTSIKLYTDPRLEIKIREYGSHKITVSGGVRDPGDKYLQREAVPFYVIKSAAIVTPEAKGVKITSGANPSQVYDLNDPKLDNFLVLPGMTIEFVTAGSGSYFVTGKKVATGEKALSPGLTLLRAVIAAGKADGEAKKAVIRRRNNAGILSNLEFDLRSVRSGRIADPMLVAGDIIDIAN